MNIQSEITRPLKVRLSHEILNPAEWDEYVKNHSSGSPFHLMAWQNLIQSAFGYEPKHIVARSAANGDVIGILPLFLVRSLLFGRMLVSTPRAQYGGVLADSEEIAHTILSRARELARDLRVKFLELRNHRNPITHPDLFQKDLYVTFRQELNEDAEASLLAIPRKTRAEIREGIKNGLEFKVGQISPDEFFHLYSQSVRDLGTPIFTKRVIEGGPVYFGADCKIFSVHWKGTLVSAVWTLFYKEEVVPYFGGSLRQYNHLAINNYMYW